MGGGGGGGECSGAYEGWLKDWESEKRDFNIILKIMEGLELEHFWFISD